MVAAPAIVERDLDLLQELIICRGGVLCDPAPNPKYLGAVSSISGKRRKKQTAGENLPPLSNLPYKQPTQNYYYSHQKKKSLNGILALD